MGIGTRKFPSSYSPNGTCTTCDGCLQYTAKKKQNANATYSRGRLGLRSGPATPFEPSALAGWPVKSGLGQQPHTSEPFQHPHPQPRRLQPHRFCFSWPAVAGESPKPHQHSHPSGTQAVDWSHRSAPQRSQQRIGLCHQRVSCSRSGIGGQGPHFAMTFDT